MDRSKQELESIQQYRKTILTLIIIYTVGVLSILFDIHPAFVYLTPINLLLSFAIVMYARRGKADIKLLSVLGVCYVVGMGVEMIGVATGDIFGEYSYGDVLGPKIEGTPWIIGLNWMMLVYCVGCTVNRITWNGKAQVGSIWIKSFLGALILVSLDVLMEPVAIHLGFWSWGGGDIPLQNYGAWFIISFLLLLLFNSFLKNEQNKVAFTLLVLQFLFFFLLGINW